MTRNTLGLLALAIVALIAAQVASHTRTGRQARLAVPEEPFRHVYVQGKIGSDQKCLVTDRAGATSRRSEPDLVGSRWRCHWGEGELGRRTLVALTGKEPSYLFLPAGKVVDPAFPWIYEAVRDRPSTATGIASPDVGSPASENLRSSLPRLRWVQLFFDRQYQGFHLQVRLPDRRFAEKRGLGEVEILTARGGQAWCWNRKLRAACGLWNGAFIAESIFPEALADDASRLLDALLPADLGRTYYLTELAPDLTETGPTADELLPGRLGHLHPLPLPFSFREALATVPQESDSGLPYVDERYRSWASLGGPNWGDDPQGLIALGARVLGTTTPPSSEIVVDDLLAALAAHRQIVGDEWLDLRHALETSPSLRLLEVLGERGEG